MFGRQKIAMVVAEILGTATLSVAMYSMIARTSFPLFGGLAAGTVVGLMTLVVGNVSSAHFNPAVTLGMWSARKVGTLTAIVNIAAQMIGGILAWVLLKYFIGHSLESLAVGKFEWKVLIAEATGAFIFTFGFASAIYQKFEGGKKAFTIGGSLLAGILVASMAANGIVNPGVALGIQSFNVAYVVGPLVGGLVGTNLYALLFAGDYPVIRFATAPAKRPATKTKKVAVAKSKTRTKSKTTTRRR